MGTVVHADFGQRAKGEKLLAEMEQTIRRLWPEPEYLRLTQSQWDRLWTIVNQFHGIDLRPGLDKFNGLPVVIKGSADDQWRIAYGQSGVEL